MNVELVNILTILTLSETFISRSSNKASFQAFAKPSFDDTPSNADLVFLLSDALASVETLSLDLELTESSLAESCADWFLSSLLSS